ncbi:MAG: ATP-dependent helicase [Streptosporangiales bacterium]|nr:ATP-dependent helicase [Streptosporangiales bacterium]
MPPLCTMAPSAVGGTREDGRVTDSVLDAFTAVTREWFTAAFAAPTAAQRGAWQAASAGEHPLVVAPTGSGKTLAAFLWAVDQLVSQPPPDDKKARCRVLYVSPLKALAVDVERNLRSPLTGIKHAGTRLGVEVPEVTVGIRSGDTPAEDRRRLANKPPDILITTPESLFLLLTSQAREALRGVETVIVDEVHAVTGTKRGAHLALSLERLDALLPQPAQRIGLSATVRPVDEVARFLGGTTRQVTVVQPPTDKQVELRVVVPVEDMRELGTTTDDVAGATAQPQPRNSIWPHVEERVLDLVQDHRSTIVFANSRRAAERLCARLNETWVERQDGELDDDPGPAEVMAQSGASRGAPLEIARAHHGSVSKEQRAATEEALKAGQLPAVVATSSLELGIDMGAVDLVVQVEAPPSVASGLQRVGRAGHQVGAVSKGVLFPKYRGDLLATTVTAERMTAGLIERMRYPRNPLDVLAQQIIAAVAVDDWPADDLLTLARRAAPFETLPQSAYDAVLDMLAGRYPSDEFAELRPRLVWDRVAGTLTARPGAQRVAVVSGGTIPDRGMFGAFLVGGDNSRVGELDEEMVYESRVGDVFTLGSTSWRIEEITHDRVLVSPAPGQAGRLPFWKGDSVGRPAELGKAIGAFTRELAGLDEQAATVRLRAAGLDDWASSNLTTYLAEQRAATGHLPDDQTLVVERYRDELGDWRVALHSPFGAQVHAPWALVMTSRLREQYGVEAQAVHSDDGIVLRIPDTDERPPDGVALFDPDELEPLLTEEVGKSALFAARFRECAARSLLLPRQRPGKRMPLWQQRQRSAQLLQVASKYASFPVVLETMRECLQDVFDVPGLVELMRDVERRNVRLVEVETPEPSPFARSLVFGYVGAFVYEGDAPLAERKAQALALDSTLLAELLGQAELRELLDPGSIAEVERELARLTPERAARDAEDTADLLRVLGPLTTEEAAARGVQAAWLVDLEGARRAIRVRIAGVERWAAVEDAGRLRDALGTALPPGVPEAFLQPADDPLGDLVARYARTHGPFRAPEVAAHFGLGVAVVSTILHRLGVEGRVAEGEFRPGGSGTEWCDVGVLRRLRRRSLAALRQEAEPVPQAALATFLPAWQHAGVGKPLRGLDGLLRAVEQLQGAPVPASALESLLLPARVADYAPTMLDELTTAGEVVWAGCGALSGNDGWVCLALTDSAPLLLPPPAEYDLTEQQQAILDVLDGGGALFFRQLSDRVGRTDDTELAASLWDLVWSGHVTGDTLAPLRSLLGGRGSHRSRSATPRGRYTSRRTRAAMPSRSGPPTVRGRWSLTVEREPDATRRAHAVAETLLDRHGIVTRGAVAAERVPGGFAAVYRVLKAFEETGKCRRGYFVEGLGAAQFATPGAVDRLRLGAEPAAPGDAPCPGAPLGAVDGLGTEPTAPGDDLRPNTTPGPPGDGPWHGTPGAPGDAARPGTPSSAPRGTAGDRRAAVTLPATDPANPYGAALPWPERPGDVGSHRPGRKAGALVVLLDGQLVLYVERGGRTLLSWTDDPEVLQPAVDALALAVRDGHLGKLSVERADGESIRGTPLADALRAAGFHATPKGLRLRA